MDPEANIRMHNELIRAIKNEPDAWKRSQMREELECLKEGLSDWYKLQAVR